MKKFTLSLLLLLFATALVAQNDAFDEVTFQTLDELTISASYATPSVGEAPYPAVILIHQGGSSREEWLDLPLTDQLLENGYAILAYDVRMHGKSDKDGEFGDLFNNPNRAPLDLKAAIAFLKAERQIDSDRIGIIGASIGANLACVAACENDFLIKTAVSLSSKTSAVQNLSGSDKALALTNVFHIASAEEQGGKRAFWANELYELTSGERKVEIASGSKHGSFILREHQYLQTLVLDWLKNTL